MATVTEQQANASYCIACVDAAKYPRGRPFSTMRGLLTHVSKSHVERREGYDAATRRIRRSRRT